MTTLPRTRGVRHAPRAPRRTSRAAEATPVVRGSPEIRQLDQDDGLAIHARNTHIKLIWVIIGAIGEPGIQFGPIATDRTIDPVFFLATCYPDYTDEWACGSTAAGSSTITRCAPTSVRGLYIEVGIWNENAACQSFHLNYRVTQCSPSA